MIKVKNHQIPPTIRVDRALGMSSEPGETETEDTDERETRQIRTGSKKLNDGEHTSMCS